MTNSGKPASNDAHIMSSSNDSMEQIRELLFGEQQRHTDQHLARADHELATLRTHTEQALSEAESRLRTQLDQLGTLGDERYADLQAILQEGLSTLQQQLEQRIDDVQTLLQSEQAQLARDIDQEQERLQHHKLDRKQLAGLLMQIASQIHDDD